MRKLFALSLAGVLIGVSIGSADLETPENVSEVEVPAQGIRAAVRRFKANEEAQAIVSGEGATCLGLYVFDSQGNCVAKDDVTSADSSDDLTAKWIPSEAAWFSIEVRNGGPSGNAYEFVLK